jgi:subtilase family serine protease
MIRRLLACLSLSFVLGTAVPALCANPPQSQPASRITEPINDNLRVVLKGSVHPLAQPQFDKGAVMPSMPMERMLLVLKRSAAEDKALAAAIEAMERPGSRTFHQWMTAEQIGAKYGVSQDDLSKVSAWLAGSGFKVSSVSKARGVIEFSGSAMQVSSAFHTEIHSYLWNGKTYTANAKDPEIPAALAQVVAGFASLNNFPIKGAHSNTRTVKLDKATKTWTVVADKSATGKVGTAQGSEAGEIQMGAGQKARPELTTSQTTGGNTIYAVTPYDFATIYNLMPLWSAGLDGTGQQIAIVAESDISPADVDQFRSAFGLPVKHLNVIHNGAAPGLLDDGDQEEASIDVEWAGAVAKNATIDQVVSTSTALTAGIYLSMTYAVDNAVAPVLSESYQTCESALGPAGNLFYYQTWQQAAAEGITVVVSAGDSGSAGCDIDPYQIAQNGLRVNGFASTPYDVAVGGTDFFVSQTNPSAYWSTTNDPTTQASALSYIPEVPWNNSCASPEVFAAYAGGSGDSSPAQWCDDPTLPGNYLTPEAGGGGASSCSSFNVADYPNPSYCAGGYPKPDWQSGVNGIPNDGVRDLPDVSLFASYLTFNSSYLYCMTDAQLPSCNYNTPNGLYYSTGGGTSFAAPAFAGIVALVNQKTNSPQGLANYYLYAMAGQEFGSTASPNSSQTNSCNSSLNQGGGNSCTFYDVSVGTNALPCEIDSLDCINAPLNYAGIMSGYSATAGYDLVTGLGSVNAENLVNNWATLATAAQPTAVTLSASSTLTSYGEPVTLSGSVTPLTGSGTPPGSISIQGMQLNQASIPVINGSYSQLVAGLLPGAYTITASYVGEGGYLNSVSQPVSMTIAAGTATSTIALTSTDSRSGGALPTSNGQIPYGNNLVATVTVQGPPAAAGVVAPTGSVAFSSNGKTLATVALTGNSAVYTAVAGPVGSYSLTAAYSGDANYNSSGAVTQSYSVVQAATSIEAHSTVSSVTPGTAVTLTAEVVSDSHVNAPTGSVFFTLNGAVVGTSNLVSSQDPVTLGGIGTATLSVPASQIAAGNNVVVATYSGDQNFLASTSTASSFVNLNGSQPTQMTMTASTSTATNTTPVTILATLSINGAPVTVGSVNFLDNGKSIAQVPVVGLNPSAGATSGTAKLVTRLAAGTHQFVGIYSGAGNLIHPTGTGVAPITVTGSQITTTVVNATSDVGTPTNYDVTAMVVAGGKAAPTGTLNLEEPSLNVALNTAALDPNATAFGPSPEIPVAKGSQDATIVVGDFNGDGIPDFAATSANLSTQLMVYLGNGDGTFQSGIGSVVTTDPTLVGVNGMVVGDFNADGVQDIAVGFGAGLNGGGSNLIVMLGNGDGTLRQGQVLSVPYVDGGYTSVLSNLVTADYNSDGIQDIAFTNDGAAGTAAVEVFFGVGDGSFSNHPTVIPNVGDSAAPSNPITLATGDVNNDGNPDLVAFINMDDNVAVILGNGDGTFQRPVNYPLNGTPQTGALGDMNHDGYADIVVPNGDGNVSVLLNNEDGTFASAVDYFSASIFDPPQYYYPEPWDVVLADINNDGNLDVVIANNHINQVSILYGTPSGSLSTTQFTPTLINTATGPWQVAVADLNNDGFPDIVVNEAISKSVGVLLNGTVWSTSFLNVALDGAAAEKETLSANYSGDSANLPSSAVPLTLAGSNATIATKLDWSPSANSMVFGTAVPVGVLNAQVANSVPGTIAYVAQSNTGAITSVVPGTILPAAGAYSITATFTPTNPSDYAPSIAASVFNVAKAGVTETLTSSAAQDAAGASVTLSDTVVSNTTGVPTGSVSFFAGSLALGTSTVSTTGIATVTTTSLPVGTSSITANYTGDSNFNPDAAAAISITVGSPSIVLAVGQPTMTITAGGTGTEALTVTPQLGYTGDVSFTCGSLPAGITCSFSPSIGAIGAGPLQSTLTVTTIGPSSTASAQNGAGAGMIAAGAAASLASILLLWLPGRRKRLPWAVLLLMAGISAFSIGCGGNGSTKTTVTGPAASTLSVASSATKIASGGTATFTATLTGTNAASATGSINFYDGGTQIGQANIANGSAQLTVNSLGVGIHTITASYAGDTLNEASNTANGVEQAVTGQTFFTVIAASGTVSQSSVVNLTLQ